MVRVRSLWPLLLMLVSGIWAGCGTDSAPVPISLTPTPLIDARATVTLMTPAPLPPAPNPTTLVTAREVDADHWPIGLARSFTADIDRIYAVARIGDREGTKPIRATIQWLAVNADGYRPGELLLQRSILVHPGDRKSFFIEPSSGGFPSGAYRADLFLDDRHAATAEFSILGLEQATPAASPAPPMVPTPVGAVEGIVAVLAHGVTERHEPVGAAIVFTPDTERIYLVFTATDIAPGSQLEAVWIAEAVDADVSPDYEIDRSSLTVQGSVPGHFWLSRPHAGFPTGRYRVELTLDGQPVGAYPFTVEE